MKTTQTTPWVLRPIRPADDPHVARIVRDVMTEHGCGGDGFAIHDGEVAHMSRSYRGERAGYYVIERAGDVFGGAGFAQLQGSAAADGVCELRKMYFRSEARGLGLGRAMLALLLDQMRSAGFRRCYLETTSWMERAQDLYRSAGFVQQAAREGDTGHHGCNAFFSRSLGDVAPATADALKRAKRR